VPLPDRRRLESDYLEPLKGHAVQGFPSALLQALGKELAAFLLPETLLTPLCAELLRHSNPNAPIYLRLAVSNPVLGALPWEYLYLETTPFLQEAPGFLCLNPRFHLIRRSLQPVDLSPRIAEKVRILVVWADPNSPSYAALGFAQQEAEGLMTLLQESPECRRIQARVLAHATPDDLKKALDSWQPHVLHFIGHGDTKQGCGQLILQGDQTRTEKEVPAQTLCEWLSYPAFRLLTLSACRTASVGAALTNRGIPAVVAMQLPWRDKIAVMFCRTFYSALVASAPAEEALCQARQSLSGTSVDWGIPTLFLAGDRSQLLDIRGPQPYTMTYPDNADFVGRENVMKRIRQLLLSPEGRPVALVGLGGIGKTQLAVQYVHRFKEDYPGGVFWLEAHDTASLRAGYAGLSEYFPSAGSGNAADQVRNCLQQASMPTLLIFNNLTGRTDLNLLPSTGSCRILATTREGYLAYPRFYRVDVERLDSEAGLQLLQTRRPAVSASERESARAIVARVGGMPLALALAAHHVDCHGCDFTEYWERLAADPLETLTQARKRFINLTGHDGSLFDTMHLAYRELNAMGAHVLQVASCFAAQGISLNLLQEVSGVTKRIAFLDALADLEASSLIKRDGDGWISLHELVRDFALDQAGESRNDHIARTARLLTQRLRSANARMDWGEARREIDHCRAVAELCERYEVREILCDLMAAIGEYLFQHADPATATECYTRCLQLVRARDGVVSEQTARFTRYLALTHLHLDNRSAALEMGHTALTIAEAVWEGNAGELADYYNDMGYILKRCEHLGEALKHYEHAIFVCPQSNRVTYASITNNLGTLQESLGNLPEARAYMVEALKLDRELLGAKHPKIAIRLNNIGRVTLGLGNAAEALELHRQALEINLETFEARHPDVAACYYYMGRAEDVLGRHVPARTHYLQALAIYLHFHSAEHRLSRIVRDCISKLDEENGV